MAGYISTNKAQINLLLPKLRKVLGVGAQFESPSSTEFNLKLSYDGRVDGIDSILLFEVAVSLLEDKKMDDFVSFFNNHALSIRIQLKSKKKSHQDSIWHFDTECIEDHGAYIAIAERMRNLADGDLPLQNITNYVDVEDETAWLEFVLDAKKYHWDLQVEDDWVDTEIFGKFIELLANRSSNKKYTYLDLRGQDCLIGCCTSEELAKLRKVTELDIEWLS